MGPTQTLRARCPVCEHDDREIESRPTARYVHIDTPDAVSREEWCLYCGAEWFVRYPAAYFARLLNDGRVAAA